MLAQCREQRVDGPCDPEQIFQFGGFLDNKAKPRAPDLLLDSLLSQRPRTTELASEFSLPLLLPLHHQLSYRTSLVSRPCTLCRVLPAPCPWHYSTHTDSSAPATGPTSRASQPPLSLLYTVMVPKPRGTSEGLSSVTAAVPRSRSLWPGMSAQGGATADDGIRECLELAITLQAWEGAGAPRFRRFVYPKEELFFQNGSSACAALKPKTFLLSPVNWR